MSKGDVAFAVFAGAWLAFLITSNSCSHMDVRAALYKSADRACVNNGGLESLDRYTATCADGAEFDSKEWMESQ